jgi:hypothetical protein
MVVLMCRLLLPVLLAVHASAYYRIPLPGPQSGLDGAQVLLASSAQGLEAPRRTTSYAPPCMQDAVNPVLDTLTAAELEEDLRALTSFHTRRMPRRITSSRTSSDDPIQTESPRYRTISRKGPVVLGLRGS